MTRPLFVDAISPQRIKVTDKGLVVPSEGSAVTFSMNKPKENFDTLVVHGDAEYILPAAVGWCNEFGIPIHFVRYDGSLSGSLIPNSPNADSQKQLWQLRASENPVRRLRTAKAIVQLKLSGLDGEAEASDSVGFQPEWVLDTILSGQE